jgi:two-component system sensor histidine kinase KdpD
MLLAIVLVAVVGGWRPALVSTVVGFLLADFLYTRPYYSLRVGQLVDVVALGVFVVVAIVIGGLVDILTRQGVQVARSRAEATGLARLLAERLASDGEALAEATSDLRAIFDLDAVAVLRPTDDHWEIEQAVGAPTPQKPEQARFTIELADRRVLAINGSRLDAEDTELLQTFLTTVRQARERTQARALRPAGNDQLEAP